MERLNRLSAAECRKKRTGSCMDCPVRLIGINQVDQSRSDTIKSSGLEHWLKIEDTEETRVAKEINRTLCPPGARTDVSILKDRGPCGPTGFGC